MKQEEFEQMAITFGFKPDKYYSAGEKMFRKGLKHVAGFGRF